MQTSDSPRFASPVTLLKKLAFTGDGAVLLHATKQQVFVWDVKNTRLCGTVDGELLGIAEDGQTFITRLSDQNWVKRDIQARSGIGRQSFLADPIPVSRFALWHTMSCAQLQFASISPETYSLHQRFHVLADRYRHLVRLDDIFGVIPSRTLDLEPATHEHAILENWLITPDDQYLAVIYYVSGGGFDWNGGVCVRLDNGQKVYSFDGGRDDFPPYLYFSPEHRWLMSPSSSTLSLYDLATGHRLSRLRSGLSVICAHPIEPFWVDVNATRSKISLRNLAQPNTSVWEIEPDSEALDVEFHPEGRSLAIALSSGSVELRDVKTGRLNGVLNSHTSTNIP